MSALVAFLSKPLPPSLDAVAAMCADAFGTEVSVQDFGADLRDPRAHRLGFELDGESFVIAVGDGDYAHDQDLASRIESERIRERFAQHAGWFSVEWDESSGADFERVYPPIGKLIAQVCDENALALFSPQYDRFALADDSIADRLRSAQPLGGFGVMHTPLGCLLREGEEWRSAFPTDWGWVQTVVHGGADAPDPNGVEKIRDVLVNGQIRAYRSAIMFSLFYRPFRVAYGEDRSIGVHFRNVVSGSTSRVVYESEIKLGS